MKRSSTETLKRFKRHLEEYRSQLEKASAAIQILEISAPESEEFSDALASLQVCAKVLEPYSEVIVDAIEDFTEDMYEDDE